MPNGRAAGLVAGGPGEEVHLVQVVPVLIGKVLDAGQQGHHFIGRRDGPELNSLHRTDEILLLEIVVDVLDDAGNFGGVAGHLVHLVGNAQQKLRVMPAGTASELLYLVRFQKLHQRRGEGAVLLVGVIIRPEVKDIPGTEVGRKGINALIESLFCIPFFTKDPVDGIDELPTGLFRLAFPRLRQDGKGIALLKVLRLLQTFPQLPKQSLQFLQRLRGAGKRILFLPATELITL